MWGGIMFKTKSMSKSILIYRLMLKKKLVINMNVCLQNIWHLFFLAV